MTTSKLTKALQEHEAEHGDTYIAIHHLSQNEFAPDDDLMDITAHYDKYANLFIINVYN